MTLCPICATDDYRWREGCSECGHVDEDRIALERRHRRTERRRARRDRR